MASDRIDVKLGLNQRGFETGLKSAKQKFNNFAKGLGQSMFGQFLGAQGVMMMGRKLSAAFTDAFAFAKKTVNLETLFGGGTGFVQQLILDAEDAGIQLEGLRAAFGGLSKARERAMQGDARATDAFAMFGIGSGELKQMNLNQIFQRLRGNIEATGGAMKVTADQLAKLKDLGFIASQVPLFSKPTGANAQFVISPEDIELLNDAEGSFTNIGRTISTMTKDSIAMWTAWEKGIRESDSPVKKAGLNILKYLNPVAGLYTSVTSLRNRIIDKELTTDMGGFEQRRSAFNKRREQQRKDALRAIPKYLDPNTEPYSPMVDQPQNQVASQASPLSSEFASPINQDALARAGGFIGMAGMFNPILAPLKLIADSNRKHTQLLEKVVDNTGDNENIFTT